MKWNKNQIQIQLKIKKTLRLKKYLSNKNKINKEVKKILMIKVLMKKISINQFKE